MMDHKQIEGMKDYVYLMLGAPVIKIELTDSQVISCITTAEFDVQTWIDSADLGEDVYVDLVQQKALIRAMLLLARIRGKYDKIEGMPQLDAKALIKMAADEELRWDGKIGKRTEELYGDEE
jgi:hypothetical protein